MSRFKKPRFAFINHLGTSRNLAYLSQLRHHTISFHPACYSDFSSSFSVATLSIIPATVCPSNMVPALGSDHRAASLGLDLFPAFQPPRRPVWQRHGFLPAPADSGHCQLRCGGFCQHIQGQFQGTHVVAQVFLFQPFEVLYCQVIFIPDLRHLVRQNGILLPLFHAVHLPCIGQLFSGADGLQPLVDPFRE